MRRLVALLVGLALGLVALAPARLLLPAPPLAAAAVSGAIWRAELAGAALGSARIGDLALALQPVALLRGRLQWTATGGLDGSLWRSLAGGGTDALSGQLTGAPLPGLPVAGITLTGVTLALDGRGRCLSAGGQVQIRLGAALAGQTSLSGAPACTGTALTLPLASGDGRVRLDLAIMPSGWSTRLVVAGAAPAEAAALAGAGLRSEAGSLVQQQAGLW